MGNSYQTILATGDLIAVQKAITMARRKAAVISVGDDRWAVIPKGEDGYAETEGLASLLSLATGSATAAFDVFDSDVLVARLYNGGECYHEYLSDQTYLTEMWDDDDNEFMADMLGRLYPPDATPPSGPLGADPMAFMPLGVQPLDQTKLREALCGPEDMADMRHHAILHALNIHPLPLRMRYQAAIESGLTR